MSEHEDLYRRVHRRDVIATVGFLFSVVLLCGLIAYLAASAVGLL